MKKESTTQVSATDWKAVDALQDHEIDFSDLPEVSPEQFAKAIVRKGLKPMSKKTQLMLSFYP